MGNYEQLKQAVSDVIKTNGNQEITGAILQNALLTIISTIGNNFTYAGIATPTTNPGTPDANVFYIAGTSGVYPNFRRITVEIGEAVIFEWRGKWEKKVIGLATSESLKSLNNALKGEPSAVSNNIRNAFIYLGDFATWAEAQTELDKLRSKGIDYTKIGSFRMLLNGRNVEVHNWVQNWTSSIFTQTVQGSIKWDAESQTMNQSLNINIYERRYTEGTGWTTWQEDTAKIGLAQELSTEEGSENKAIFQKAVSEALNPLQKIGTFFGKRFSVIGDSIGVYPYSQDSEVTEDDMWWKIAIDYFNGTKGVINCVARTSVADSTGSDTTAFVNRISTLNLSNTDVLFIEGGMNDLGFKNVALGDFDFSTLLSEQEKTTFVPAYRKMIEYIQSTYPNIKIVICTITPRNPFPVSENFPWKNSTTQNTWIEYNEAIRKLADCYGCYLADISKCGLTFFNVEEYTKDGVHPLKVGQNMIGQRVIMDLE